MGATLTLDSTGLRVGTWALSVRQAAALVAFWYCAAVWADPTALDRHARQFAADGLCVSPCHLPARIIKARPSLARTLVASRGQRSRREVVQ
jgi:hypothetical protein